jgi:CRP/FNR family transcriptional regulator, cyclic AMP receptor protein
MVAWPAGHEVIGRVRFLTLLHERERQHLLPLMTYRSYARRTFIIRAGERSDRVYLLVSGRAQIVLDDGLDREMILCPIGPDEFFGELGSVDGAPRSAGVQALEVCETVCFPRVPFIECVRTNPDAAMLLVSTLVARVRATDLRVSELAFAEVAARVARALLESAEDRRGEGVVEHSTEQLGRMVAASREMVSRIIKKFQLQGLIRRQGRAIVIVDGAELARCAQARR